ncbi:MAG: trypsin-like serine protease [Bdellovibrionales bacterium]|nr:trypsin-like serine protease [Bdellovibrionales bacterium]
MKNTALVITILATLIGTASVSFGDTKTCAQNLTVKSGLSKLPALKSYYVVSEFKGPVGHLDNDQRQPLDRIKNPEYNGIGAIDTKLGRGSAWLGNECLVWTAKHVLGRNQKVLGQKVTFNVGQSQTPGKDFEYSIEGEVVASGNPDANRADNGAEDWALIKLKKSFNDKLEKGISQRIPKITTAQYSVEDAQTCKTLEVAGYPGEKSVKNLWWQGNCSLDTSMSGLTAFNVSCPVTPGNSGGPLLCREADGSLRAIGVMNQQVASATRGLAVNFTADWANAKAAYQKYKDTCN